MPTELYPRPTISIDAAGNRVWINRPASGRLSGTVFTDGSALRPESVLSRRAGWAIVMIDGHGNEIAAVYGLVPHNLGPEQTARDGEDCAFWAMPHCCEHITSVYVDCQGTLECATTKAKALHPTNPRAHLWEHWWATMGPAVLAHKTLAHATETDVLAGKTTWWDKKGQRPRR